MPWSGLSPIDWLLRCVLSVDWWSLDWGEAWIGMTSDIAQATRGPTANWFSQTCIALVFALPVGSAAALLRGRAMAVVSFGLSLLPFGLWFLFYADGWHEEVPSGVVAMWAGFFNFAAWVVLAAALARPWRWQAVREYPRLVDPRPLLHPPDP